MENKTAVNDIKTFINSVKTLSNKEAGVVSISQSSLIGGDNDRCTNEESEACKDTINTGCVNRGHSDLSCNYAYNERCIQTD